ncbi:MAG TPA: response regulator [Anaerolineae bacterium]|jgi:DNA-binding NarL/FixJ family response regulator/signal transduction histidine kinase
MSTQVSEQNDMQVGNERTRALENLAQQLETNTPPHLVLMSICKAIVQQLNAPQVAIALRRIDRDEFEPVTLHHRDETVTASNDNHVKQLKYPIAYRGETIGQLVIAIDSVSQTPTPIEETLLREIAQRSGTAAHVVRITRDLQHARERLVLAREEERRKLRRNLHDAVGPTLTAIMLKMGALRDRVTNDHGSAAMVVDLREQIRGVVTQIRHVIYDLRPPALEELGLLTTIREQAQQFSVAGLEVRVYAPEFLPALPAAVEVATYRIILEALNNVAKHSRATQCDIRLRVSDSLYVDVTDNGMGLPDRLQPGVGISSIRERVAELGGSCSFKKITTGGTHVAVRLPMFRAPELPSEATARLAVTLVSTAKPDEQREPVKVILVDDHRFFREGVRNVLKTSPDVVVIGETATGLEAIEMALAKQPDIILMDVQMPGLNGIETTQRILRVVPHVGIIIMTMLEDTDVLLAALRAGARGYIYKDADEQQLLRTIRAVACGESLFGPDVSRRLLQYISSIEPGSARTAFPDLTEREREILGLMAQGRSNEDIAMTLGTSIKTVRNQVSSILSKLQVTDRETAAARARAAGMS